MDFTSYDSILLLACAFVAGLVDAVVGGGGLIQLPAMLFYIPNESISTVLGTNKVASFSGTTVSAVKYGARSKVNWRATIPAVVLAVPFSFVGAFFVSQLNKEYLKPIMLFLFLAVGIYTFLKKDFGKIESKHVAKNREVFFSCLVGSVIGFYDGFFGPGTGSFLVFLYVVVFGFDFLQASVSAKIVNVVTNFSALLYFFFTDNIIFSIAIPVAISNILGSFIGTNLALKKGASFVRIVFLVMVSAFILKMAKDVFFK